MKRFTLATAFLAIGCMTASALGQDTEEKVKKEKRATAKVEDGKVIVVDSDGNTRSFDIGDGTAQRIVVEQETTSDGSDVKVFGKAVIVGPDGEQHEIELNDVEGGVWVPEGLKGKITIHGEDGTIRDFDFEDMQGLQNMGNFAFSGNKFMIGVNCKEIDGALKAHLGLENGLVIEQVVDDTPAAEAGLKQFDVLVRVNGKDLENLDQLVEAVQAAGEESEALKLVVVRSGDDMEVEIQPVKRDNPNFEFDFAEGDDGELKAKLEEMMKRGELGPGGDLRIERFGPGIIQGRQAGSDDLQDQIEELKKQIEELNAMIRKLQDNDR